MKISGKYLAWAIIHLNFFTYLVFADMDIMDWTFGVFILVLMLYFGWRFIENMKVAFK